MIVQALAAPLMIPLMIFGGFYLNNDSTPVYVSKIQKFLLEKILIFLIDSS